MATRDLNFEPAHGVHGHTPLPPSIVEKWQAIVDTLAELANVPAGLIMCVNDDQLEVCVSSRSEGNPFEVGQSEILAGSGLFCETVIKTGRRLLVPDALIDDQWLGNTDVKMGMRSYLGFPIRWPDLAPFGTICILDNKSNGFAPLYERLVEQFRDVIEHHLTLVSRDTERQLAADLSRAELTTALQSSERQLQEAQAELARVSRQSDLGQFAGTVVHEMNQPLAAIVSSTSACQRWLDRPEPDVAAARNALARVIGASQNATEVMASLRSLAQRAAIELTELNLHEVVREVTLMAHDQTDRAAVEVRLDLAPDARSVLGDRPQLHLVLHNLVRNAVDAMSEIHDRRRELRISARSQLDGQVVVHVDDSGAGIDPQTASRIFQSSFTTKLHGMGLGLAICRSVIEAHGGVIVAEDRPDGPGARFTFTLQARPAADDRRPRGASPPT